MTQTAVLLVRPQARGRQPASYHRGIFAIEGREATNKNPGRPPRAKVKCRRMGERSPMTRLQVAQDLYKENPSSVHCMSCNNRTQCSNKA